MAIVYKESGHLGNALFSTPLVAMPAVVLMGLAYGYICVYNPIAKIAGLIPFAYGGLTGLCIHEIAFRNKCRNSLFMLGMGAVCGVLAVYCSWVGFIYALAHHGSSPSTNITLMGLFFDPFEVLGIAEQINVTGWVTISNSTPSGLFLWFAWATEAAIIAGFATFVPYLSNKRVFCEFCDRWCEQSIDLARFRDALKPEQATRLADGDLNVLAELPANPKSVYPYLRLDSQRCHQCNETAVFQVNRMTLVPGKNGATSESAKALTKRIVLTEDSLEQFQAALAQNAAGAKPALAQKSAAPGGTADSGGTTPPAV